MDLVSPIQLLLTTIKPPQRKSIWQRILEIGWISQGSLLSTCRLLNKYKIQPSAFLILYIQLI